MEESEEWGGVGSTFNNICWVCFDPLPAIRHDAKYYHLEEWEFF